MRVSPIRRSRKRMTQEDWETLHVKNDRMSASRMKFTFLLLIPTISASSAIVADCVSGRNPYENPEEVFLVDRA